MSRSAVAPVVLAAALLGGTVVAAVPSTDVGDHRRDERPTADPTIRWESFRPRGTGP